MWLWIRLYAASIAVVIVLDLIWLGLIMARFYKEELGSLARRAGDSLTPIWWAAGVVYLLLPLGTLCLAVPAAGPDPSALRIMGTGFLFGTVVYGVYEFTNYATLADWPAALLAVDTLWGGVIGALSALAAHTLRAHLS
jgi:uncharacterized membrane protein